MNLITCKNTSFYYEKHLAVKDVSFTVEQGDYICVVGENGTGKSTLLKGILGLHKPASGEIVFENMKSSEIGYLPQQTVVQRDFPASVREVVMSGCIGKKGVLPFLGKQDCKAAEYNMELLNIRDLEKKSYRDLSGGQQQRVLLARALCATEKLLVLDEPVNGLDPVVSHELYCLIKKLNIEQGITILMVSHDFVSAVNHANKILHMNTSQEFFGTTEEYKHTHLYEHMMGGHHECSH